MDISVIVPVYNVEMYLKDCLDSILNQDFKGSYEIICVNDGSTDNSLSILEDYKANSNDVVVITQKNKGLSGARNTGIKSAKGKYLFFLDSDDFLTEKDVLTTLYNECEKDKLNVLVADFEFKYEDEKKNHRIDRKEVIKNRIMDGKEFYELGRKTKSIRSVVWNKLYKREMFADNNLIFMEGILHEDMEFTPRMYQYAKRVKYIDKVIIGYRQREGSIMNMSSKNIKSIDDLFIIADSLNSFNMKYKSKAIYGQENFIYLSILRKMKNIEDSGIKEKYCNMLKERKMVSKFIKSDEIKYIGFGILYFFKIV